MQDRHRGELPFNRRIFLKSGIIFGGAALAGVGLLHGAETEKKGDEQEAEVGPPEDLMREHGVLKRVLLIYGEALRRLDAKEDLPPEALADAAGIIRHFVEDYHEKLEEDFLFPRFEKANQLVDLVKVLRTTPGGAPCHGYDPAIRESTIPQERIRAGAAHCLHATIYPHVQSARSPRGHRSLSCFSKDRFAA